MACSLFLLPTCFSFFKLLKVNLIKKPFRQYFADEKSNNPIEYPIGGCTFKAGVESSKLNTGYNGLKGFSLVLSVSTSADNDLTAS